MGIINFKGVIIISVILFNINFAQTIDKTNSLKIDTAKNKNSFEKTEKESLQLYKLINDFNYHFGNSRLYIPGYMKNSRSNWKNKNIFVADYKYTKAMEKVNKSLHYFLTEVYGMRRNYDLGEIGRYLDITKKIVTIILWILSF